MKKWIYYIIPAILTVAFIFFYVTHVKEAEEKARIRKAEIELKLQQEAAKKAEIEENARKDATRRSAERLAQEAKKEADRIAKWEADGKEIQDATDKNNAEANEFARKIAALEIELDAMRRGKEILNAKVLTQAKAVEQALIDKRTAEIEIQRRTQMVREKAAASHLVRIPSPIAVKR